MCLSLLKGHTYGLLWKKLRAELQIAYGVEAKLQRREEGAITISSPIEEKHFDVFHDEVRAALQRLRNKEFSHALLEATKSEKYLSIEAERESFDPQKLGMNLAEDWAWNSHPEESSLDQLNRITPDTIIEVATKYLNPTEVGRIDQIRS